MSIKMLDFVKNKNKVSFQLKNLKNLTCIDKNNNKKFNPPEVNWPFRGSALSFGKRQLHLCVMIVMKAKLNANETMPACAWQHVLTVLKYYNPFRIIKKQK